MEPRSVSTTKAPPPSRTAPTRRTVSVPTGSAPSRTTMAKAPDLSSTSAQRSALVRSAACTTSGAPSVQPKVSVPDASTHAARSPPAVTPRQAERKTAAAPPAGAQTVSLPRGNPPCGSARSSDVSPVATACASRFASRSASGFALGKRSASSCRRASTWADIGRRACHHETRTGERQERGVEAIPNGSRKQEMWEELSTWGCGKQKAGDLVEGRPLCIVLLGNGLCLHQLHPQLPTNDSRGLSEGAERDGFLVRIE